MSIIERGAAVGLAFALAACGPNGDPGPDRTSLPSSPSPSPEFMVDRRPCPDVPGTYGFGPVGTDAEACAAALLMKLRIDTGQGQDVYTSNAKLPPIGACIIRPLIVQGANDYIGFTHPAPDGSGAIVSAMLVPPLPLELNTVLLSPGPDKAGYQATIDGEVVNVARLQAGTDC